jgi:hypothetical protein
VQRPIRHRSRIPVFIAIASTFIAVGSHAAGPAKSFPEHRGPTLAVEDTLPSLMKEPLPEILVTAPRQTLDEILRRVADGEAQRDSLIHDQAYTLYVRMVGRDSRKESLEENEPYLEVISRIYQERPGKQRVVMLKEWTRYDEKKKEDEGSIDVKLGSGEDAKEKEEDKKNGVTVSVDNDMSEQFVAFAFDPEARSKFRFKIEDRKVIGDQLIYVISFTPKSPLDLLPTGRAWVNTNDFVILREEFSYTDRSPAPLFMESLDSCILERTRIDGRYWVLSRVMARVTLTDPVRWMGKLARTKVPKVADFVIKWDDWIVNGDIPDSLFTPAGGEVKR